MSQAVPFRKRSLAVLIGAAAGLSLLQTACAGRAPATTAPAATPATTATAAEATPPAPKAPILAAPSPLPANRPQGLPLQPADGQWLIDEYGRRYFLHELPKDAELWRWEIEGQRIRLIRGLTLDVADHNEKSFLVKIYGPDPNQEDLSPQPPTQEELAQIAATYASDLEKADRLSFQPLNEGLPAQGQWRQGFAVADIDGDGRLDIVHGPPRKGGSVPAVFLGDGTGRWRRWAEARFPALPLDYGDAAVADFNRDGKADLAVASHLRGIVVMVGDGRGGFTPWSQGIQFELPGQSTAQVFTSRAIEVADWNGDGRPDLLALGEGPRLGGIVGPGGQAFSPGTRGVVVFLNQGDGTWTQQAVQGEARMFGDKVAVGDFNADGRIDFATASAVRGSRDLVNLGQADGTWKPVEVPPLRAAALFRSTAAADFDRDGRDDIAVGFITNEAGVWRSGVDVLSSRADGSWERRTLGVVESNTGIWSMAAGDLDGDGAKDLVALTGNGEGWVFLGDGKGSFVREEGTEVLTPDEGCTGHHAALADVDGDGRDELVAGFAGEGSALFGQPKCLTGGSLRVWKAVRRSGR